MHSYQRCATVTRTSSIFVVVLGLVADLAIAQIANVPDVKVGDQWQFVVYYTAPSIKPNRTWVIKSVTATAIEGTENEESLVLTKDLNVLESPRHKDSQPQHQR